MKKVQGFSLLANAKRRVNFQLTIASFAFAFSAIILGIGVAAYNGDILDSNTPAYIAAIVFAIFEFGSCVAMLSLWVSLYNTLKPIEVVRRLMAGSLAVFSIILAYIASVVIVDVINLSGLMGGGYMADVGWEAINGLVVAFTGIGLMVSLVTCVMVHSACNQISDIKEEIKETIVGKRA